MGVEVQNVVPEPAEAAEPTPEEVEAVAAAEEQQEEKAVDVPEAEEKTVEAVEESKEGKPDADRNLLPPSTEETAASFKEDSYYVKDLKESEKKALQDLKAKIEEAINANSFLAPPKPQVPKEAETEKKEEDIEKKQEDTGKKEAGIEEREVEIEKKEEDVGTGEEQAVVETTAVVEREAPLIEVAAVSPEKPVSDEPVPVAETVSPTIAQEVPAEEEVVKEVATPVTETPGKSVQETSEAPGSESALHEAPGGEVPEEATAEELEVEKTSRDLETSLEDLSLWGVPLLHSKGGERSDVILLKFLRARDFKVNDAFGMLQDALIWRKDFNADNLLEEELSTEYDSVAYMHGLDKEGHPVCYNHYGVFQDKELYQKTFEDDAQFNNFLRWRIQVVEKSIKSLDFSSNGVHSVVQITDMKDSPGFAKRRNITKRAFTLLQDNYPELVAKQIFINVPWYFGALYNLHAKFVTPRSRSKVVVARPGKVTETLFKYISPENVPVQYGGLSRRGDSQFDGVEAPVKEVVVKGGEKQSIEIPVAEPGSTVVWDIAVVGWEVTYGEEYVPSAEGSYTVIIQKSKKVASTEESMRNSFKAFEPGKVVLNIDNTISRRKRLVVYRYFVKEAAPPPPAEG